MSPSVCLKIYGQLRFSISILFLGAEVFHKVIDIPVGLPSIMQYVRESRMPPPRALPPLRLLAEPKARAELFELVVKPIEEDEEYLARAKAKSFKQFVQSATIIKHAKSSAFTINIEFSSFLD